MSTLLYSLGRWSYRHSWRVLIAWLLILVAAGGSAALWSQGTDDTFKIPGTESQEGLSELERTFPEASGTSAQVIIVAAPGTHVDEQPYAGAIRTLVNDFTKVHRVLAVTDPFDKTVSGLVNADRNAAIVQLQFDGTETNTSPEDKQRLRDVVDRLAAQLPSGATSSLGGDLFAGALPGVTVTELVGVLVALLVLVVTFGSFALAGLPLLVAIIGVGLSMSLIFIATAVTPISSTTPLLALMLGLAVGIDYALFIAARHQDQLRRGEDPEESAARATATAGSAVVFAGVTVLIALIGLSFAGIPFLTTMGVAASVAVALAVLVSLTLTPAVLGFLGRRAAGGRRTRRRAAALAAATSASAAGSRPAAGASEAHAVPRVNRWVALVTRHPVITTVAVALTLGLAAIPATSLTLALPNAGMLPADNTARHTYDLVEKHFGPGHNGPLVLTGTIVSSNDPVALMKNIGDDLARLPGVAGVALATPNQTADTGIVQIVPKTAPDDPATADLVRELRAQHDRLTSQYGVDLKVTGFTAVAIDISDRLGAALLPFGIFVVGLSFVLLLIVFRSIAVPLTASLGYLLSVAAAFGAVGAVFEWGWLADVLHVTKVGPVISFMPIVLMGVLFGLAMDYQVFLVTRMREDYVHAVARAGANADRRKIAQDAVRSGFSASSRVVTAAALIMLAVFAAFVPEGDSTIKPIALGLAVGVAVDAFLVRMTLIPALLALLGDRAWSLPHAIERRLPHLDVEGEAIERELSLKDWPEPNTTAVVAAEEVALEGEDTTLFAGLTLRIEKGDAAVFSSADPRAARAALYTIAGRIAPTAGRLRVAGHLLPGREAWVRSHVAIGRLSSVEDPLRELHRTFRARPGLVVLVDLDELAHGPRRDQAVAELRTARAQGSWTVLASGTEPQAVAAMLADAGFTPVHHSSISTLSEVTP